MLQQLTNQELKDVADVMFQTRVSAGAKFFSRKQSIYYCLGFSFLCILASSPLSQLSIQLGQFCLMVSILLMALAAYIFFYIRGVKKNVQKMVKSRIGDPIEVVVHNDHIRYNNQNFAYKNLNRAFEYKNLIFLTIGQNFMVVKSSDEILKVIKNHQRMKYVRYKKPFNLFAND